MKVKLLNNCVSPTGDVMKDAEGDVTLKRAVIAALQGSIESDKGMPLAKIMELGDLLKAVSAHKKGDFEMTSEQITLVKERAAQMFAPVFVYAIVKGLEG